MAKRLLTYSRMAAFKACNRKHDYAYEQLIRALRVSEPLEFGTAGHAFAQAYWEARQDGASDVEALGFGLQSPIFATLDPYVAAKLRALAKAYAAAWSDTPLEVLAVEKQFRAPLLNPMTGAASATWELAGKLDVLVRNWQTERVAVIEHKFTANNARPGSTYRTRLAIDAQIDQYFLGSEVLLGYGRPADVVLYDVITKPSLRPRLATPDDKLKWVVNKKTGAARPHAKARLADESPEAFEARVWDWILKQGAPENDGGAVQWVPVHRTESQRLEFAFDAWQIAQQIDDVRAFGRSPRHAEACDRYGTLCEFFQACAGFTTTDDASLFRRAFAEHEELVEATEASDEWSEDAA